MLIDSWKTYSPLVTLYVFIYKSSNFRFKVQIGRHILLMPFYVLISKYLNAILKDKCQLYTIFLLIHFNTKTLLYFPTLINIGYDKPI